MATVNGKVVFATFAVGDNVRSKDFGTKFVVARTYWKNGAEMLVVRNGGTVGHVLASGYQAA